MTLEHFIRFMKSIDQHTEKMVKRFRCVLIFKQLINLGPKLTRR